MWTESFGTSSALYTSMFMIHVRVSTKSMQQHKKLY